MADVYKREDACSLLRGKHVLFIGDSNIRALYKDFLWLYKMNSLIGLNFLKRRLENRFLGDKLIARSDLTRGRDFTEHRIFEDGPYQHGIDNIVLFGPYGHGIMKVSCSKMLGSFKDGGTTFEFLFVTRCYCNNIINMINDIKDGKKHCPDVILMNSCLWDVSRWGPSGVSEYKSNMDKLMKLLTSSLPKHVLFIWATALPIAALTSGGLIIKQIEFMQAILRIHVIEANSFTASLAASYGYDVLDFHHYMRFQIIRRSADGIHFLPAAMRFLTNLLLTHIALSWDVKLPGNLKICKMSLASSIENAVESSSNHEMKQMFRKIELLADTLNKSAADTPSKKNKKRKKKKMQNMRVTHYEKQSEKINPNDAQPQRTSMKTPPYYHKASPVLKGTIGDIQNNNFVCQTDYSNNNLPSSSTFPGQNIQITRRFNIGDVSDLTFPEKDFRLIGFEDFNNINLSDAFDIPSPYQQPYNARHDYATLLSNAMRYVNPSVPVYSGYGIGNQVYHPALPQNTVKFPNYYQQNLVNPSNNYYDRFSSYRNHPYKSSHDDRMVYNYQYTNNPGPMRQRKSKYNYRR